MGSNTSGRAAATRATLDALRAIVQTLRESSRRAELAVGLGGAQLFVLETLAESPALSLNELAARTHTHQSSVSTVVSRLVERRLVRRTQAAGDARRIELSLAPRGRRVLSEAPGAAQQHLVRSIEQLPLGSARTLASLLEAVARGIDGGRRRPPMFFSDTRRKARARHA
jgi:DNA-binding MarR family transcriptional regulator